MSLFRHVWRRAFARHLLATNVATSGILMGAADLIEQRRERRQLDTTRTYHMTLVGLIGGLPHHYFYLSVDKLLPGRNLVAICKKILVDQFVGAPIFAFIFIFSMALLQSKTAQQGWNEFKQKFPAIYLFDWLLWPPCQWLNFRYVPSRFRVLYVNCVTVVWDVFLSFIKHYDQIDEGK